MQMLELHGVRVNDPYTLTASHLPRFEAALSNPLIKRVRTHTQLPGQVRHIPFIGPKASSGVVLRRCNLLKLYR